MRGEVSSRDWRGVTWADYVSSQDQLNAAAFVEQVRLEIAADEALRLAFRGNVSRILQCYTDVPLSLLFHDIHKREEVLLSNKALLTAMRRVMERCRQKIVEVRETVIPVLQDSVQLGPSLPPPTRRLPRDRAETRSHSRFYDGAQIKDRM